MANSLGRDIKSGEAVVMSAEHYVGNREQRVFICQNGFGMLDETRGGKIFGYWLFDNEEDQVRGEEISKEETQQMGKIISECLKEETSR